MSDASGGAPRWWSENPGKAWAERFFLLYSPVWMTIMGLVMLLGIDERVGDVGYLAIGLVVAVPLWVVPAIASPENRERPFWDTYWFKANVYLVVFGFWANYAGTEYFFDVLGMVYDYPRIGWNLDAALVGSGAQRVPILMYLLTHAYFMTYHTSAIVVLRRLRTARVPGANAAFPLLVFVIGYFWAWMETRAMANPLIAESFYYTDMARMLRYGSAFYALYFVGSFPIFYGIDERPADRWSVKQTVFAGLAASTIVFFLLDVATHLVGTI